nr:ATPase, AAA-type, core [Tanacetum cinerariifolium]
MEGLHMVLNNGIASKMFHEVRIGSNIHLSHLFYADDVIILLDWNQNDMENIIRILNIFYIASGLKINFHKSNVFGVGVSNSEVVSMAACTGCEAECYVINSQLNLGKMTKRKKRKEQPVTFAEVEGVDAAKAEILKIVSCVSKSKDGKDRKLVSKVPKGVLLTGPPGTGKTLLARSLASGVSFHVASGTEFMEIVVGRGASLVTEPFVKARSSAPSIIFINDIDDVGGQHGISFNGEADHTLNQKIWDASARLPQWRMLEMAATYLLNNSNFSSTVGALKLRTKSLYVVISSLNLDPPLQKERKKICYLGGAAYTGLQECIETVMAEVEQFLSAEQKAADYKSPKSRPTNACTRVVTYLTRVREASFTEL